MSVHEVVLPPLRRAELSRVLQSRGMTPAQTTECLDLCVHAVDQIAEVAALASDPIITGQVMFLTAQLLEDALQRFVATIAANAPEGALVRSNSV